MKFLLIFLTAILLTSGCTNEEKHFPLADSQADILSYLPAETEFLTFMSINALRTTEFWDTYFKPSLEGNYQSDWLSEFESETGIGLNKGVNEIYTAATWNGNNVIAVVFQDDESKAQNYFSRSNYFIQEEVNKKIVFKMKADPSSVFLFINYSLLLIINDYNYLKQITSEQISGKNSGLNSNKNFITVLEKIENKKHYWIASNKSAYVTNLLGGFAFNSNNEIRSMLQSLKDVSLSAKFGSGVEIKSVWTCNNSKNAYILTTALKGSIAFDLLAKEDVTLNMILNKMKINRISNSVNITVNLNSNDLNELKILSEKNK